MAEDTYFDGTHRPLLVEGTTTSSSAAEANAGSDAIKAVSVQGIAGGKAVPVSDNGGSLTVDGTFWQATQPVSGTVAATQSGTWVSTGAAADGAAVSGNPVLMAGQDGTLTQSLLTDSSGRLIIVGINSTSVGVVGNVANAGSDAGNPVKVGGVYNATLPTFTTGQRGGDKSPRTLR